MRTLKLISSINQLLRLFNSEHLHPSISVYQCPCSSQLHHNILHVCAHNLNRSVNSILNICALSFFCLVLNQFSLSQQPEQKTAKALRSTRFFVFPILAKKRICMPLLWSYADFTRSDIVHDLSFMVVRYHNLHSLA